MNEYKQAILVRTDLKLTKGKMSAQVSHASVECVFRCDKKTVKLWREQGMKKIVLKVSDQAELLEFKKKAESSGLVTALIIDAGHTQIEPGTMTCLGIGPDTEQKIDEITSELKLIN